MTFLKRTRLRLVPFALGAMALSALVLAGCGKEEKPAVDPASPASYMNDTAFRQQVADKRKELLAIVAERKPLADRMQELVREHNENLAELQKIPEWNELHKKVVALNEKYEATKRRQLAIVRDRLAPKGTKTISK